MRITEEEREAIVRTVAAFDPKASIYLFGSRNDDRKRGGDIDIALLSSKIDRKAVSDIRLKLYELIGEQKIDIIFGACPNTAFFKMAVESGTLLYGKPQPGDIATKSDKS